MSLFRRRRGDLIRNINDLHGVITYSCRRTNTATVRLAESMKEETYSWWDLKIPTDETAQAFGVKDLDSWSPIRMLTRIDRDSVKRLLG